MPCPHVRLTRLLLERLRGARLLEASREDWASATFNGMRHRLDLALPAAGVADQLAHPLDTDLPAIPGHLIADLSIVTLGGAGEETLLRVEALTLEEQ